MAKARRVRIDPDAPFAAAAAETVKVRGPELLEFREGTLDGTDIEQLHSMRVASRRLRAALEVYEGCFPKKPHRRLLRLVKETADALSEARDLDVQIDYLTGYRAQVPAADRAGIDSLITLLRARRAEADGHLAPALRRLEDEHFTAQVDHLVESAKT
jgi:CHAD domain-containing protein